MITEDRSFVLSALWHKFKVSLQLRSQVWFRHLIPHWVIPWNTQFHTNQIIKPFFKDCNTSDMLILLPSTRPMPSSPGRNLWSAVSPTYMRLFMVSMCSACVASVPAATTQIECHITHVVKYSRYKTGLIDFSTNAVFLHKRYQIGLCQELWWTGLSFHHLNRCGLERSISRI